MLVVLLAIIGYRAWRRSRVTPEERERRRCARLVAHGKIGDATLVEIREILVFYSYCRARRGVHGVAGISRFAERVRRWISRGVRALSVKYDPRNPANSIVMAEEWSGLRARCAPAARESRRTH